MVVLVVPCYNEEKRLDLAIFAQYAKEDLQFLFVDDGSADRTFSILQDFAKQNPHVDVLKMPKNGGKARAVRAGMLAAAQRQDLQETDWVGFWDADCATPLEEVSRMLKYVDFYQEPVQAIWGSRVYRLGSDIQRSALRHYLGRGFATLIAMLLKVESYDSQCGAKLFQKKTVPTAFSEEFLSNWIFDVEVLLRLKNFRTVEYPVMVWRDVPGSKVKVAKEIGRVFRDILRIRKKYLQTSK